MVKFLNEICVWIVREIKMSVVWKIDELFDVIKEEVEVWEVGENRRVIEERSLKVIVYWYRNVRYYMMISI